jgi:hypothetical protein
MSIGEKYLILHKVRGEPAFDVAECIGEDSDGEIWIIPTSGHRAYPFMSWNLLDLSVVSAENLLMAETPKDLPEDWPDHYTTHEDKGYGHKEFRREAVTDLLSRIGLNKRPKLLRRLYK